MKIAFTSCSNIKMQKDNQPIWGIINSQQPDLLLLLGDNVYMGDVPFNAETLEDQYKRQLAEPHFNKLICEIPYLAVWDNHDFGTNDLFSNDLTTEQIQQSRDLFDRYLKNGSAQPDTLNVYCTHTIGNVKIIMLDVRYYQLNPDVGDDDATLLGKTQEDWLLEELRWSTGITVICSGMAYSFGKMCWKNHTNWSKRFTSAVARISKPLFLGGNVHTNEFKQHILSVPPVTRHGSFNPELGPEVFPPITGRTYFYEAISSSVGRNHVEDDELPHNKYGIVNISTNDVEIILYSQKPNKIYHKKINVNSWDLI